MPSERQTLPGYRSNVPRSVQQPSASPGADDSRTRQAAENLVALYEAWKRPADAEHYQTLLVTRPVATPGG